MCCFVFSGCAVNSSTNANNTVPRYNVIERLHKKVSSKPVLVAKRTKGFKTCVGCKNAQKASSKPAGCEKAQKVSQKPALVAKNAQKVSSKPVLVTKKALSYLKAKPIRVSKVGQGVKATKVLLGQHLKIHLMHYLNVPNKS